MHLQGDIFTGNTSHPSLPLTLTRKIQRILSTIFPHREIQSAPFGKLLGDSGHHRRDVRISLEIVCCSFIVLSSRYPAAPGQGKSIALFPYGLFAASSTSPPHSLSTLLASFHPSENKSPAGRSAQLHEKPERFELRAKRHHRFRLEYASYVLEGSVPYSF